jgi:serine protease inhibitor
MLVLCGLVGLTAALGSAAEPREPKPARAGVNHAATANNDFSFDLYTRLASDPSDQSLFFSPYSISTALVIVAEGARAETAGEMGKVLRFPQATRRAGAGARERPWDLGPIHTGLAALNQQFAAASRPASRALVKKLAGLRKDLAAANKQARTNRDYKAARKAQQLAAEINKLQAKIDRYELRVANALWGEKTYPFKQSYLDTTRKHHGSAAFPVDFINAHEAARKRINAWVEKQTRDRIKELVPSGALNVDTRLVVTNAIYFRGQWTEPFETAQTKDRPFTLTDGKTVRVPTMHHGYMNAASYAAFTKDGTFFDTPTRVPLGAKDTSKFYPDRDGFEMLELPYKGGELSMVVVLPRSAGTLAALEKKLTAANLQAWIGKLRNRSVEVFLPKFKLESAFDLTKTLPALGMKRAFRDPRFKDGAQFDGMSEARDAVNKLYITRVLHKAFVEVSEKGTEAAAATAVIMEKSEGKDEPVMVPFTPTFKADRPFVFLIRDQKTGTVLFLGRILQPKTGG